VIVFDLGAVLSDHDGKVEALAEEWGVEAAALEGPYWAHRLPYDRGVTNLEYFSAVASDLGVEVDETLANHLGRVDAENWATIRPTAQAILADLHTLGHRTAILSNAAADMAEAIERSSWRALVGEVFVSGRLGVVKPEPEIYRLVAERLGVNPAQIVFIDDRADNVEAAREAGWTAHLWTDDAATRRIVTRVGE